MRIVLMLSMAAMLLPAQDVNAKPSGKESALAATPTQRPLSENEVLKIRLTSQKVKVITDQFKIADYNKAMQPVTDEQRAIFIAACKSVGVPEDKMFPSGSTPGECEFVTGYDQDDNAIKDLDGKPIPAHVRWSKPAPPEVPKK